MAEAVAERLFNLLAYLLASRTPVTEEEILDRVTGYVGSQAARERTFDRDKQRLQEMGIELRSGEVGEFELDRESAFLPTLDLRPSDALVLSLVLQLSLARAADDAPEEAAPLRAALLKLFASYPALAEPAARYPVLPYRKEAKEDLSPIQRKIAAAVAARRTLVVRYARPGQKPGKRRLNPYGLFRHEGSSYLVAYSLERKKPLTFKVSRITRAELAHPDGSGPDFERPPEFRMDRYARRRSWDFSEEEPSPVTVRFEAPESLWIHENWQPEAEATLEGEATTLRTPVRDVEAFGRYLLRFTRFTVESPMTLRRWIAERMAAVGKVCEQPVSAELAKEAERLAWESEKKTRSRGAKPEEAPLHLRRLTVMLPYILSRQGRDGIPLGDLARQFGTTKEKIERDVELLTLCGLPDYGPDRLITWDPDARDEGRVRLEMADYLKRPLKLDPEEAAALLTAIDRSRALLGPAIPRALRSVTSRLHDAMPPGWKPVPSGVDSPSASRSMAAKLKTLLRATRRREIVEFEYIKLEAGSRSRRRVVPELLRPRGDGWHLFARDLGAGALRAFRLDCIRDLRKIGPAPGAVAATEPETRAKRGNDGDRVVVRFDVSVADGAAERFAPLAQKKGRDGSLLAVIASYGPAWLGARLLPYGPSAEVISPAPYRTAIAERAVSIRDRNR